jgi:hypothetical protein
MTKYLQPKQLNVKKFFRRYLIISLLSLAFLFVVVTHAVAVDDTKSSPNSQAQSCSSSLNNGIATIKKGEIKTITITPEQYSLQVQCINPLPVTIFVKEPGLKAIILDFSNGDLVDLSYDNETKELTSLSVATISVDGWLRFGSILISGFLLYLLTWGIVYLTKKDAKISLNYIFVGQDKRLSNSKSQMAIWFFVVMVSYISFNILRAFNGGLGFVGGIGIPENLLVLSGISAVTYGGAKVITQSQVNSKPGSKEDALDKKALPLLFISYNFLTF